jgi:hypothetical protein
MSDATASAAIPIHPVAPRMKNGTKQPHIGPNIDAYRKAHSETIGHESDHWWAKVLQSLSQLSCLMITLMLADARRWPDRLCTGIGLSKP